MYKYIYKESTQIFWNKICLKLTRYWYEPILMIFKFNQSNSKPQNKNRFGGNKQHISLTHKNMLSRPLPTINFEELRIIIIGNWKLGVPPLWDASSLPDVPGYFILLAHIFLLNYSIALQFELIRKIISKICFLGYHIHFT